MKTKTRIFALAIVLVAIIILIVLIEQKKPERVVIKDSNVGLGIGKTAPNFELEDISGKKIQLNDFRGKAILLNFWASWCAPCRIEMPEFQKIYDSNPDEIVVVGVNLQENKADIEKFIKKLGITFPILLDPDSKVKSLYNVFTQPVTYFIDKDGKIINKKFGPLTSDEINEKVGKLLQEEIKIVKPEEEIKTLADGTKYIIHPSKLVSGGPPKDGIPSIDNPKFISIEEANKFLDEDELVLGINFENVKRAYPFQILVWHELVNDFINGKPILISYCPLCGTGIAFDRTINNEAVEFVVSGKLYNSDLVMYDRKTESYWEQINGRAIVGKLTGMRLKMIPIDTITWKDWKTLHPDTEVLSKDTGYSRNYGRDPYGDYYTSTRIMFDVENKDDRLHPKSIVYGIEINSRFKAYPEDKLKKDKSFEDSFADVELHIERNFEGVVKIIDKKTNKEVDKIRSFWFAWYAFHPETELYISE